MYAYINDFVPLSCGVVSWAFCAPHCAMSLLAALLCHFPSHSSLLLSTWRVCSTPRLTKLLSSSFLEPKCNSLWFLNMPCLYQKILEWTRDLVGWYPLELSDWVLLLCDVMERGKKMWQDHVRSSTTRNYLWVVEWSTESVDFSRTTNGKSTTSCKLHEKST
jgi:hypothetical protein